MKLKNSDLEAMMSHRGYQKFFNAEFSDIVLVLEIRRQNEDLQPALKAYIAAKKVLAERYCDKDEKEKPLMGANGEYRFAQNPGNLQEFRDQFNILLDVEVDVDTVEVKVSRSALSSVAKWSGADMSIIYPFIKICEDAETGSNKKKKDLRLVQKED